MIIHGLASHPLALNGIRRRLAKRGYQASSEYYPYFFAGLDDILERIHAAAAQFPPGCSLHFVTHSLGALMARAYIGRYAPPNVGRLVMIAPPNHGTPLVDYFASWPVVRALLGSIAVQLGTRPDNLPRRLPCPPYPTGIIAGTRSLNPLGSRLLPQPHDGLVSLASTFLPTMSDHIRVPYSHRLMLSIPAVQQEVVHFLQHGSFSADRFARTPWREL